MTPPEEQQQTLQRLLLDLLPPNGAAVGNATLLTRWTEAAAAAGFNVGADEFTALREDLVGRGLVVKGKGRGGSTARSAAGADASDSFTLSVDAQATAANENGEAAPKAAKPRTPRAKPADADQPAQVLSYRHSDRRKNNPEVGLVNEASDPQQPRQVWAYNPHLDPVLNFDSARAELENLIDESLAAGTDHVQQQIGEVVAWLDHALAGSDEAAVREVVTNLRQRLTSKVQPSPEREALQEIKRRGSPYLQWAGKAERTSFEVDTVSLHVHERIDPMSILSAVRKRLEEAVGKASGKTKGDDSSSLGRQASLFEAPFESLPLRNAVDFYRHDKGWANRLIAGDSLLVMNSLLVKEGMAGQVQTIYIDPPYGIKYGSNFQPFVGKRDVKDRSDADLTQEPEMIKAFRDTWELGIHSYLTYLRDRLLTAKELLTETGSIFVQIGDENLHYVRQLLDEVFGAENLSAQIAFKATDPLGQSGMPKVYDYIVWYAKNLSAMKYRPIYRDRDISDDPEYRFIDPVIGLSTPTDRGSEEFVTRVYRRRNATSSGFTESCTFDLRFLGQEIPPAGKKSWSSNRVGMERVIRANRMFMLGKDPYYKQYQRDFPLSQFENCWTDKPAARGKRYVVETAEKFIERCMLMTTDPGDLVIDPTCGSGTTALVAEKWGRRWITCDTSRVAVTLV